jgi:hypothetical protein
MGESSKALGWEEPGSVGSSKDWGRRQSEAGKGDPGKSLSRNGRLKGKQVLLSSGQ